MLDSFARGFKMIWASIKMGWADKRLLLPSVLTVFSQSFFFILLIVLTYSKVPHHSTASAASPSAQSAPVKGMPTYGLLTEGRPKGQNQHSVSLNADEAKQRMQNMVQMMRQNGPGDPNGFDSEGGGFGAIFTGENGLLLAAIGAISWMINRVLEGVTTALVYSHLTEGKGTGKFSDAFSAVFSSLPAILILGIVTWIARRLATMCKKASPGGALGMSMGFLTSIVEIFWTLAGHLILPAVVIEGCSFWGGLKRADKIASGNLLTMGVGEVGVEGICRLVNAAVMGLGMSAIGAAIYLGTHPEMNIPINPAIIAVCAILWVVLLVIATSASAYIKAAFYTCLYVWSVESETVEEGERSRVQPPAPLALALSH